MAKTREQIEDLKKEWLKDPCWHIWDTAGFEEYKSELEAFEQENTDKYWERLEKEKIRLRTDLHNMEFGQSLNIINDLCARRVPGGWIYEYPVGGNVFVPYKKEFKPKRKFSFRKIFSRGKSE